MKIRKPNRKAIAARRGVRSNAARLIHAAGHLPGRIVNKQKKSTDEAVMPAQKPTVLWIGLLLFLTLALVAAIWSIAMKTQRNLMSVYINDDGKVTLLETETETVGQLLETYGIELEPGDEVIPAADAVLEDGEQIKINRAMLVTIVDPDQIWQVRTIDGTVGDALKMANVELGEDDLISDALTESIDEAQEIIIDRVTYETVSEEREIAFGVKTEETDDLKLGTQEIGQEGKNGIKTAQIRVKYLNGEEVSRELVDEKVTTEPTNKIVLVGTQKPVTASRPTSTKPSSSGSTGGSSSGSNSGSSKPASTPSAGSKPTTSAAPSSGSSDKTFTAADGKEYEYLVAKTGTATAYSHGHNKNGRAQPTYSGTWPKVGTIAVDRKVIPIGTKLYVPGYGFGIAEDIGNFSGNWIDVFYESDAECYKWGMKTVTYYIVEYP